jgi:hypothetical protein
LHFLYATTATWSPTSPLNNPRAHHRATTLPDGTVLVVGGTNGPNVPLNSAEIYNPTSDSWLPITSLHATRVGHTISIVNGQAFVVGGGAAGAGEVYDAIANTRSYRGALLTPRGYHTATVVYDLPNIWVTAVPTAQMLAI